MKEYFIEAHEQLIEEYLEKNPNASEQEAYEKTADFAYEKMIQNLADRADFLRD
jgi:hypothetical protein